MSAIATAVAARPIATRCGSDMRGDSIRGGTSHLLKPGDVMFVPAGLPHGFVSTVDHVTFVMTRYDTK